MRLVILFLGVSAVHAGLLGGIGGIIHEVPSSSPEKSSEKNYAPKPSGLLSGIGGIDHKHTEVAEDDNEATSHASLLTGIGGIAHIPDPASAQKALRDSFDADSSDVEGTEVSALPGSEGDDSDSQAPNSNDDPSQTVEQVPTPPTNQGGLFGSWFGSGSAPTVDAPKATSDSADDSIDSDKADSASSETKSSVLDEPNGADAGGADDAPLELTPDEQSKDALKPSTAASGDGETDKEEKPTVAAGAAEASHGGSGGFGSWLWGSPSNQPKSGDEVKSKADGDDDDGADNKDDSKDEDEDDDDDDDKHSAKGDSPRHKTSKLDGEEEEEPKNDRHHAKPHAPTTHAHKQPTAGGDDDDDEKQESKEEDEKVEAKHGPRGGAAAAAGGRLGGPVDLLHKVSVAALELADREAGVGARWDVGGGHEERDAVVRAWRAAQALRAAADDAAGGGGDTEAAPAAGEAVVPPPPPHGKPHGKGGKK